MGERTEEMLAKVKSAFKARDLSELSQQYDQVVVLREAVLAYLRHVGRGELSDAEADKHAPFERKAMAVAAQEFTHRARLGRGDLVINADDLGTGNLAPILKEDHPDASSPGGFPRGASACGRYAQPLGHHDQLRQPPHAHLAHQVPAGDLDVLLAGLAIASCTLA